MKALPKFVESQLEERLMESRVARIESDVEHIKNVACDLKQDVQRLHVKMEASNDSIVELDKRVDGVAATQVTMLQRMDDVAKSQNKIEGKQEAFASKLSEFAAVQTGMAATMASLATQAELKEAVGELKEAIKASQVTMITWFIGTAIAMIAACRFLLVPPVSASVPMPPPAPQASAEIRQAPPANQRAREPEVLRPAA